MKFVTICLTYFKSLSLLNLGAALYSVRRQDLEAVESLVVVDNDTGDSLRAVQREVDALDFPMPTFVASAKHGDAQLTHSWSTNKAVRLATAPWVFFTRADYLLDFSMLAQLESVVRARGVDWDGFVTANGCHLNADVAACESTDWRERGPGIFRGVEYDHTSIDAGVWMARRESFDRVGGLDEELTAWGHAQTHFQWKLYESGTEFVRVPETLFFHPAHAAERDITLANAQLRERGCDLRVMWERYDGARIY